MKYLDFEGLKAFKSNCDDKYLSEHQSLVDYQKTADADKKYMPKGSTSSSGSVLSISTTGAFNNYGNNGQAFNAVRDLIGTTKYQMSTGSKCIERSIIWS